MKFLLINIIILSFSAQITCQNIDITGKWVPIKMEAYTNSKLTNTQEQKINKNCPEQVEFTQDGKLINRTFYTDCSEKTPATSSFENQGKFWKLTEKGESFDKIEVIRKDNELQLIIHTPIKEKETTKVISYFVKLNSLKYLDLINEDDETAVTEEKIYFDYSWLACDKSRAGYYRIIKYDQEGNPRGKVQDFFMSGVLQWEGYASAADRKDGNKIVKQGESIYYYRNGNKKQVSNFVDNSKNGLSTYWRENGTKETEVMYTNGKINGRSIEYYETGEVFRVITYTNGEIEAGGFFIHCDTVGNCQNVFYEEFQTNKNINKWPLIESDTYFLSKIYEAQGLLMESKTAEGFEQVINIPFNPENDFIIESLVGFVSGDTNSGQGLIWGYIDSDNYYYYAISANGYYSIGQKKAGIDIEMVQWTKTDIIYLNDQPNLLGVYKQENTMHFLINGNTIKSTHFEPFTRTHVGFMINSGKKKVLFRNLIVRQAYNPMGTKTSK